MGEEELDEKGAGEEDEDHGDEGSEGFVVDAGAAVLAGVLGHAEGVAEWEGDPAVEEPLVGLEFGESGIGGEDVGGAAADAGVCPVLLALGDGGGDLVGVFFFRGGHGGMEEGIGDWGLMILDFGFWILDFGFFEGGVFAGG